MKDTDNSAENLLQKAKDAIMDDMEARGIAAIIWNMPLPVSISFPKYSTLLPKILQRHVLRVSWGFTATEELYI